MGIMTSVIIEEKLYKEVKELGITFADCMRAGITVMLAERGKGEYDNNLILQRRIQKLTILLDETLKEKANLEEQNARNNHAKQELPAGN